MKIAVASGKGGTGKTTLAVNLSAYLNDNSPYGRIILADLDVEEPNSGLFISGELLENQVKYRMIPEWQKDLCSHCGLCDRLCKFNAVLTLGSDVMILPELCHSCHACSELCPAGALPMTHRRIGELRRLNDGGLTFIESRLDIGQEQAVPLISQSIEYIEHGCDPDRDLIILDSPPGTSCPVIEVAENSDFVILVTEPTPFGLHDLSLSVNTMRKINRDFAVVINRWGIGNADVIQYCSEQNIEIITLIPHMRSIAEIYSGGGIIYDKVPEFREALAEIAGFIAAGQGLATS